MYPCVARSDRFAVTKGCQFPGIDVEILDSIAQFLNYSIVTELMQKEWTNGTHVYENSTEYDMIGSMHTFSRNASITLTLGVIHQKYSILTSAQPISIHTNLWSLLSPFDWPIWMVLLGLGAINAGYTYLFSMRKHESIMSFRAAFKANLLSVTFGMFIMTKLYSSGLLTKLLLKQPKYLVENCYDLLHLPADITVYDTYIWYEQAAQLCQSALNHSKTDALVVKFVTNDTAKVDQIMTEVSDELVGHFSVDVTHVDF